MFFLVSRQRSRGAVWIASVICFAIAVYYLSPTEPVSIDLSDHVGEVGNDRKVLLIGVDAMSWNRVLPLVRRGMLPNIARLMDEGAYAVLYSVKSYRARHDRWGFWSPVVWTTIATGVYPEKHGILDFQLPRIVEKVPRARGRPRRRKAGVMANSQHRRAPALWNIYSHYQKPVGIVGWWASWPAEDVEGILVSSSVGLRGRRRAAKQRKLDDSDRFSNQKRLTYPEDYTATILSEVGLPEKVKSFIDENVISLKNHAVLEGRDLEQFSAVVWQDRLYQRITKHLLKNETLSIYATYYEGVDAAAHKFWRYMISSDREAQVSLPEGFDLHRRVVDRYYAVLDSYIGDLIDAAGDDVTVVICSDHGFQATGTKPPADHSGYGVLILAGPGIRKGGNQLSIRGPVYDLVHGPVGVEDVLPTLLYMQGLPVSEELDGTVQYRFFDKDYLMDQAKLQTASYQAFFRPVPAEFEIPPRDQEEYLERLKSLGYIN